MILEVALTRLFSFITYHHMTYLVIGSAMLGFGAAGTYLIVRAPFRNPDTADDAFAHRAALFGVAAAGALFVVPRGAFLSMYI
jgi:hypothetical protein